LIARPKRGETGGRIEVLDIHKAADRLIVIAAHEDVAESLGAGNDFVRIAAVADRVAEIDGEVVSGSRCQTGIERFEIAMNVAENKYKHGKVRIIAPICL